MKEMKTILLVEDEAIIAMSEMAVLKKNGYSVIHAIDGQQAIEKACSADMPVDLVLMDIDLGSGMDGTEAAREILKHHDIPIVFLSSHTEKHVVEKTEAITSFGYVLKNAGEVVLLASVKMAFRLHDARRKIEESEKRYSDIFNSVVEGVFKTTADGRFIYINPAAARMFGYRSTREMAENGIDVSVKMYAQPEDREYLKRLLVRDGRVENLQLQGRHRAGKELWVSLYATGEFDASGALETITCTMVDITEEWHAKKDLKASEERFRALSHASFEGILISEDRVCLEANEAASAMCGYSQEELIGMSIIDLFAPESYKDVMFHMALGLQGPYEVVAMRKDGSRFPVEIQARMFTYHGRTVRASVFRDITEREAHLEEIRRQTDELTAANEELQNAIEELESTNEELTRSQEDLMERERALIASDRRYRDTYNNAMEGMFRTAPDGLFIDVNPALAGMLGYGSPEEVLSHANSNLKGIFARPREMNLLRKMVLKYGHIENAEVEVRTRGGENAWAMINAAALYDDTGAVDSINGTCIDITRLKLAERALRESEQKYRILVEESVDPIFSLAPDGRYRYANSAFAEGVGFPADEIPGKTVYDIFPSEDAGHRMEMLKQVVESREEAEIEVRVPRADGDRYYVTSFKPVLDKDGQVISVVGTSKNVTERRKAIRELHKALKEKEILLSELQHRIKNSLNIIISLFSLSMDKLPEARSRNIFLETQNRIRSMASLYERLYYSDNPGSVELHSYLENLSESLVGAYVAQSGTMLLETNLAEVSLDTRRAIPVGLIVNELITNALKYSHPDGSAGAVRVDLENSEDVITLRVTDNGTGFPDGFAPEEIDSLGVNLVTMLTKQIGGSVMFENDSGARVTVSFRL